MNRNKVRKIKISYFKSLKKLKKLSLKLDHIKFVEKNAFEDLISLKLLDISDNEIENFTIDHISNLKNLSDFRYSQNFILHLENQK
jgi:Leucine-rich repeat (LRR) protein